MSGTEVNASKYPPAKLGALRLLAPQRSLIAVGQNQNQEPFIAQSMANFLFVVIPAKAEIQFFSGFRVAFRLPGMTILHSPYCQTLGVRRQSRGFT
jgi:hypothetical protein